MEIIIDTNFALTCTRQKIDFFNLANQITVEPIKWIIPDKVIEEIKRVSKKKEKTIKDRQAALLFLDVLEANKSSNEEISEIHLKKENVDDAIADYCNKNPSVVLATMDNRLKARVKNKVLSIEGKNFLKFIESQKI